MGINIGLDIQKLYSLGLLDRLLKDKTTGHNILWATDAYSALGMRYGYDEPLSPTLITGSNAEVIQARAQKGQARRNKRTRQHGEVCTPLWVVKKMIDHADEVWFGAPGRFFDDDTPTPRVQFDRENDWQRYVDSRRLEITCGEAPYLATRYDVETGEEIPLAQRIGILDRKLRVVDENTGNETDWLHWSMRAFEACYGYELQGDSLLTARVNLLMTFADYYSARWNKQPAPKLYGKFLNCIVWNIWQMDGLTGTLPCAEESDPRITLADFAGASEGKTAPPMPPPRCRIYDWRRKQSLEYLNMQGNKAKMMKFDYILGNPPYQEERKGESTTALPIYHMFMQSAYEIGDAVELITPARFLFNAGRTPKQWNEKILNSKHFKVVFYEKEANTIFPNTEIKGGVAITYFDTNKTFEPVKIFTIYPELNGIIHKITPYINKTSLSTVAFVASKFDLENLTKDYPQYTGHERRMSSNVLNFECFHDVFTTKDEIAVYGIYDKKRNKRYIKSCYVDLLDEHIDKYKIVLPKADGNGQFGDTLTLPEILPPKTAFTHTFLGMGSFNTLQEAECALKYIKTKFARCMLGVLKVTQDMNADKWRYVPLQDFTPASDIDWSQPVAAIDRQLYAKYGLDEQEVAFIESHVKEME